MAKPASSWSLLFTCVCLIISCPSSILELVEGKIHPSKPLIPVAENPDPHLNHKPHPISEKRTGFLKNILVYEPCYNVSLDLPVHPLKPGKSYFDDAIGSFWHFDVKHQGLLSTRRTQKAIQWIGSSSIQLGVQFQLWVIYGYITIVVGVISQLMEAFICFYYSQYSLRTRVGVPMCNFTANWPTKLGVEPPN